MMSLVSPRPAAAQVPLGFGETVCETISLPGEVDVYTVDASAGDVILVRMVASANVFMNPKVEVYDPGGTEIASVIGAYLAEIFSLEITTSGTHTILAMDEDTHTGDYCLHVQRLNNPGQAMSIAFGQVLCETIGPISETDAYTFEASAGDLVFIRMVAIANVFMDPLIRVYDPNGQFLVAASAAYSAEIGSLQITASGRYTILALDTLGDHGGDYCIHVQRLNDPGDPTAIAFFDTLCDTITTLSQTDAYVFNGEAGDVIRITMSASGNVFMDPELRLYDPNGTLIATAVHADFAVIDDLELPSSGVFVILAGDVQGDDGGDYCVNLICLSPPCGPPPCTIELTEGFEDAQTIFSYSSTHDIPYDIQNAEAAHTGEYSFKSYTSTCPASCHDEYRVDLLHEFSEPVTLTAVELWAREGATDGSAWGGKISVGHDSTWNLWWWQVVDNHSQITGQWQYMYVPIGEAATNVRIRILDITDESLMWLDDIVIHYEGPCCPWDCGDGNGIVKTTDLLALLGQWGMTGSCDVDGGGVHTSDLVAMLANWGPCP
jgi:hypothetical protein